MGQAGLLTDLHGLITENYFSRTGMDPFGKMGYIPEADIRQVG